MAGFFKKIFSFGRKEVETVPDAEGAEDESRAVPEEAGRTGGPEAPAPADARKADASAPDEAAEPAPDPAGTAQPLPEGEAAPAGDRPPAAEPGTAGDDAEDDAEDDPRGTRDRFDFEGDAPGAAADVKPGDLSAEDLVPVPELLDNEPGDPPLAENVADVVERNLEASGDAQAEESEPEPAPETEPEPEPEPGPEIAKTPEPAPPAPQDDLRAEEDSQRAEEDEPPAQGPAPEPADGSGEPAPAPKPERTSFAVDPGRPRPSDAEAPATGEPPLTWFQRLRRGLSRSSSQLTGQIAGVFTRRKLDEDTLQDLEDILIQADLGVETAMRITDTLASGRYGRDVGTDEVTAIMAAEIEKVLGPVARPLELDLSVKPHVILVVGVNGTGKTTTIGKLAAKLTRGGLKVTLAAGDTFRAAAIEQLKIWGERTGATVVASRLGADAAGLAYDAYERARADGSDVLIIDTAGRLQNKTELMNELEKIVRVLGKHDPDAPHTVLQTLDATTGQNALNQVEIFRNVAGVNGLVMTKLDGTARGGILVAISARHKLPVYFVGVGEGVDDLEPFEAREFAGAIAGTPADA